MRHVTQALGHEHTRIAKWFGCWAGITLCKTDLDLVMLAWDTDDDGKLDLLEIFSHISEDSALESTLRKNRLKLNKNTRHGID